MKRPTLTAIALIAAALLLGACGSHDMGSMDTGNSIPESADFNDADVMFAQMMIPHHEQAIEMSDIALNPNTGASAAVIALATQIKGAQGSRNLTDEKSADYLGHANGYGLNGPLINDGRNALARRDGRTWSVEGRRV